MVNLYVAVTDNDWFHYLSGRPDLKEVNFWKPGGIQEFRALTPGELLLFKLHSPDDFIVGGGVFWRSIHLPLSLAWETFKQANGAETFDAWRRRIARYRRSEPNQPDRPVKCRVLLEPFFLDRRDWLALPESWRPGIQQGKRYSTDSDEGAALWSAIAPHLQATSPLRMQEPVSRYGAPALVLPRLGQGAFRVGVIQAYARQCAITHERTLPALDAAHILPYDEGGEHRLGNGLLLRKDFHALFDQGYVTVDSDYIVRVSPSIKKEFENGREYYAFDKRLLTPPKNPAEWPDPALLSWHYRNRFMP